MKNYLYLLEHELKINVIDQRSEKFEKLKVKDYQFRCKRKTSRVRSSAKASSAQKKLLSMD